MIRRTYECLECRQEFEVTCESSDPDPDCPRCAKVLEWRPGMFAITGTKSKAMDVTQQILEQDFGMSNFRDNQREGDIAAIVPEKTATARNAEIQQLSEAAQAMGTPMSDEQKNMATQFWGGGNPSGTGAEVLQHGVNLAKQSMAEVNAAGLNPMKLLHDAGKAGRMPMKINVVARA